MSVQVILVDDHESIRAGLRMLLAAAGGIEVIGEAGDGAAAVSMARALRPDVVLMDLRMPGMDGIAATRQIVSESICDVLVLTTFDLDEDIQGAILAGAAGYLLKSVEAAALAEAIRRVAAGEGALAPEITRRVFTALARSSAAAPPPPPGLSELTEREREVLGWLGIGLSNRDIAGRLRLGEATVKTYVARVLHKLGVDSRSKAAFVAREQQIDAQRGRPG